MVVYVLHVLGIPSTIFLQCPQIIIDSFSGVVFLFHFLSTCAVAVVGGLMINRRIGGDFFQPLSFDAQMIRSTLIFLRQHLVNDQVLFQFWGRKKLWRSCLLGGGEEELAVVDLA